MTHESLPGIRNSERSEIWKIAEYGDGSILTLFTGYKNLPEDNRDRLKSEVKIYRDLVQADEGVSGSNVKKPDRLLAKGGTSGVYKLSPEDSDPIFIIKEDIGLPGNIAKKRDMVQDFISNDDRFPGDLKITLPEYYAAVQKKDATAFSASTNTSIEKRLIKSYLIMNMVGSGVTLYDICNRPSQPKVKIVIDYLINHGLISELSDVGDFAFVQERAIKKAFEPYNSDHPSDYERLGDIRDKNIVIDISSGDLAYCLVDL